MRVIDKLLRSSLLLAAFILPVGLTGPALADRPGTPTEPSLVNCPFSPSLKPRLCGSFLNTASEEVRFEIELKKNNDPISMQIDCLHFTRNEGVCWQTRQTYTKTKLDVDLERQGHPRPLVFELTSVDFNARYCARYRARRASDDMVSEIWSAWACAQTPGQPSPPKAPEFTIEFDGRQPTPNAQAIASTLTIKYTKWENAGRLTAEIWEADGPNGRKGTAPLYNTDHTAGAAATDLSVHSDKPDTYQISPDKPWLYVEVCASNYSGKNCSHQVASASAVSVVAPTPGGKPIGVTARGGTDRTFQREINLPGMDYKNQPLRTNDPESCQQLCNNEIACVAWTFVRGGVQSDRPMCWLKNNIPRAVRDPNTVSGIKEVAPQPRLYRVEMPGKDYRQVASVIFSDCERLCNQEAQCKAWTWFAPNVQGPRAMCSLKSDVPPQVANEKAVSGVKFATASPNAPPPSPTQPNSAPASQPATPNTASAPRPAAPAATSPPAPPPAAANNVLTGVDMPGKDYRHVVLNNADAPVVCQNLCATEAPCKAWTWVKPGIQGPTAMCWLKNDVPPRMPNPNTASGVRAARSALQR